MGGNARTFFSDSSSSSDSGDVGDGIEKLIDVFCNEYGWLLLYVIDRTPFQLKKLRFAIDCRIYEEVKRHGDTIRAANSEGREHYARFLEAMNPEHEEKESRKGSGKKQEEITNLPAGFIYAKMR